MTEQSKSGADWKAIEQDYRAGVKSLRQIAAEHGITEGAIRKRAKLQDWARDLNSRIKAKADDLVRKQQVREEVRAELVANEKQVVEANALAIARVRLEHREDIQRARNIVRRLMAELEAVTDMPEEFARLAELMDEFTANGNPSELTKAYHKVASRSGRVSDLKSLSDALKSLIALEREAWGLGEVEKSQDDASSLSDSELEARIAAQVAKLSG